MAAWKASTFKFPTQGCPLHSTPGQKVEQRISGDLIIWAALLRSTWKEDGIRLRS
ncbi:Hypothetical protein FKW44_012518 [Caligus rogercresseyi]|uniref:Uncharacterized protein n=1 Tax=Caligus rogercresseyi TaxID=217165 RepID=A0A7T8HJU3_CALRO|nr:Hypothetical protein FKW44_012518 [Caligus rogercresseyi]